MGNGGRESVSAHLPATARAAVPRITVPRQRPIRGRAATAQATSTPPAPAPATSPPAVQACSNTVVFTAWGPAASPSACTIDGTPC
jgi:hypothetical protein